jgi:hypothetical protein
MPQKFAFTTAAMAAALEETPVSYEDLADIERDFDDAETDISELSDSDPADHQLPHLGLESSPNPAQIHRFLRQKEKDKKVAN